MRVLYYKTPFRLRRNTNHLIRQLNIRLKTIELPTIRIPLNLRIKKSQLRKQNRPRTSPKNRHIPFRKSLIKPLKFHQFTNRRTFPTRHHKTIDLSKLITSSHLDNFRSTSPLKRTHMLNHRTLNCKHTSFHIIKITNHVPQIYSPAYQSPNSPSPPPTLPKPQQFS